MTVIIMMALAGCVSVCVCVCEGTHKGVHKGYHIYVFSTHSLKLCTCCFGIQWSWGSADRLTLACEGTWQTLAAFWVPMKGSSPPLFSFCHYTEACTHTIWKLGSHDWRWAETDYGYWLLPGDGSVCVSEQRMGTKGSVQKVLILSSRLCLWIKVSSTLSHLLDTCLLPHPKHTQTNSFCPLKYPHHKDWWMAHQTQVLVEEGNETQLLDEDIILLWQSEGSSSHGKWQPTVKPFSKQLDSGKKTKQN